MKKNLLFFVFFIAFASVSWSQVVSTISGVTICTGPSTVDVPVKVSSFTAVGSITLKLSHTPSELSSPSVIYKDPGLDAWGTFSINTSTPGTILISAFDPCTVPTCSGLTLANNTTLFTLRFTIGAITSPAVISFVENAQGTSCEYGGTPPLYTPFTDTPTNTYYINGSVTIVADPVAPGITKNPSDANVCAGQNLTVSISSGSGGTGNIADEYRYTTNNGTNWSAWSASVPSFAGIAGTNKIQSRRTADGTGCTESTYNEVSWNVVADPVAPGITKSPADATVCAGQNLTVTISSGTGGTGTVADEYRYSTNNGTDWSGWSVSVPSFAAVTGTSKIQSRRTATGTGCDASGINEVSWTVVADPVAPGLTKNPATASVCAGETLTVSITSGSGGAGTTADEYRYTTNNGTNWSAWSASVPSFAGVAGTNKIQSRRTATGTGCDESSYNEVSWTVNAKQKISGTFSYHHSSGDLVLSGADITVNLYKSSDVTHSTLLGSDVTDASGYYEFPANCPDCDYDIVATSTHSTDGAVNTTDAAQANYWGPNAYSIQKVRFHAGDVAGPDLYVGSTDAIRIQANFVNGTAFDKASWTFWRSGFSILHNPLEEEPEYSESFTKVSLPVGNDVDADMYGLVTGDFNRSFNPNITKAASASLDLVYSGIIRAGHEQEIELPLRIAKAATLGAISLVMEIPSDLVEIKNVATEGTGGQLSWAVTGNELRIGWHSPVPLVLGPDGIVATLKLRTTSAFTPGNCIRIRLASDPRNELADEMYEVIGNALLAIDAIEAAPTGVDDPQMNGFFTCYPNPSTDGIIFSYSIPENGHVTLEIFSILGKKEVSVIEQVQPAGNHRINTGHLNLANGIYTARLTFKAVGHEFSQTLKIIRN